MPGFQPGEEGGLLPEERRQRPARQATQAQNDEYRRGGQTELLFVLLLFLLLVRLGKQPQSTAAAPNCSPETELACGGGGGGGGGGRGEVVGGDIRACSVRQEFSSVQSEAVSK